jgi:hypothetical protein
VARGDPEWFCFRFGDDDVTEEENSVNPLSFVNSWFSIALYVLVAVMWLIPDRRIEKTLVQ